MPESNQLAIRPILSFPRAAEIGKNYLLTVDLHPVLSGTAWPYTDREEVVIDCLLISTPVFENQALGEPAVVLHRFGGSYGPARFLLRAADQPCEGQLRVILVGRGVPLADLVTPTIPVRSHVE